MLEAVSTITRTFDSTLRFACFYDSSNHAYLQRVVLNSREIRFFAHESVLKVPLLWSYALILCKTQQLPRRGSTSKDKAVRSLALPTILANCSYVVISVTLDIGTSPIMGVDFNCMIHVVFRRYHIHATMHRRQVRRHRPTHPSDQVRAHSTPTECQC